MDTKQNCEAVGQVLSDPSPWRGYSLDQLEQRRAINAVKSDLIKEQIMLAYAGMTSTVAVGNATGADGNGGLTWFDKIATYVSYGLKAARYARSIYSIYRSFTGR